MDDKSYLKLEKKIDVLMKKRNRIYFMNETSTTAMLDMHGVKACEKAEQRAKRHNERARTRINKYNEVITEILLFIVRNGHDIDNICQKYDVKDILKTNEELTSYVGKTLN